LLNIMMPQTKTPARGCIPGEVFKTISEEWKIENAFSVFVTILKNKEQRNKNWKNRCICLWFVYESTWSIVVYTWCWFKTLRFEKSTWVERRKLLCQVRYYQLYYLINFDFDPLVFGLIYFVLFRIDDGTEGEDALDE
jgi:hypothetical protein